MRKLIQTEGGKIKIFYDENNDTYVFRIGEYHVSIKEGDFNSMQSAEEGIQIDLNRANKILSKYGLRRVLEETGVEDEKLLESIVKAIKKDQDRIAETLGWKSENS